MASSPARTRTTRRPRAALVLLVLATALVVGPARAQETPETAPEARTEGTGDAPGPSSIRGLPPGVEVVLDPGGGSVRVAEDGSIVVDGPVTVTHQDARFQADAMTFRDGRTLEAEGNVLVVWGSNRIAGTSMVYDLETGEGSILDAIGQVDPEFHFAAAEVRKVGDDLVYLRRAEVTTCTQPTPYWSFRVSRARVRVDGYARMWNARFRVERAPVLYFPFLFWPVKDGRAPGLLLPEVGTTQNRGQVLQLPLYLPLGRSADVTLTGSYFSLAGTGVGADFRAVPDRDGKMVLSGFWIDDDVTGDDRWRLQFEQTQILRNGFRVLADIDAVSDFNYFADFERDIEQTSLPNIRAVLEMSRNGRWVSTNFRELRNEQLFSDGTSLIQQTFPELEFRGRSRRLGPTPLYLSFESSFASIQQRGTQLGSSIDADYLRGDVYPTLSAPFSPAPWLDVNPTFAYRYTYYTQSREERTLSDGSTRTVVVDDDLARGLGSFGVELVGPKLFRIYERPRSRFSSKYKHVVEPTVAYRYSEGFERSADVLRYDEIDGFGAAGNTVTYGLRSRLIAKRPRSTQTYAGRDQVLLPGDDRPDTGADPFGDRSVEAELIAAEGDEDRDGDDEQVLEPVEIASLSLSQTRSLQRELSFGDLDGDGINETSSSRSSWILSARLNPTSRVSFDLRGNWQPVYRAVSAATLSGSVADRWGQLRFSLVHRNGLGVVQRTVTDGGGNPVTVFEPRPDDTQLNLFTSLNLWGGRVRVGLEGTYDHDPVDGQSRFPNRLWSVQYSTQCCTFLVQRLARNFTNVQNRSDYSVRVDLRGVGKILDQKFR